MLSDLHLQDIFLSGWPGSSYVSKNVLEGILLGLTVLFQLKGCDLCLGIGIHFGNVIYFFDIIELKF